MVKHFTIANGANSVTFEFDKDGMNGGNTVIDLIWVDFR